MLGNVNRAFGLWLMLPCACWAQGRQANPTWLSQPQFVIYNQGYFSDNPIVDQLPFTVEAFGFYLPSTSSDSSIGKL
jgi:hypothetical protein